MSALDCHHEDEVAAAVLSGRWPYGCDEELRAHVSECDVCSGVTTVAELLREDQSTHLADVRVPAAGQVWWRAAVRARIEAVHTASRPITWMQGLAGAAVAGLAIALFGVAWPLVRASASRMTTLIESVTPGATEVTSLLGTAVQQALPLLLFAGAFVIVTPIALYFALSEKR
jgi:hypothetical protein